MTPSTAPAPTVGEFQFLRLKQLVESPMNNRKHYDEKKLAELTESIRKNWILTPLLARPNGKFADFEIAAGHRRYRAALETGLDLPVPVMVRQMSDAEFLEVLTIENLQREDVHPMDEALGYKELCEKHGYTADVIADRVGKSKEYVYGRMKLADLIPELQARFYDGVITSGHAILFARLPEASQIEATKELFDEIRMQVDGKWTGEKVVVSVRQLQVWIQNEIHMDLSKAIFDIADPDLLRSAGACIACPKRTGAEPHLWPELAKKDQCIDRSCFHKKVNAFIDEQVTAGSMVRLTDSYANRSKKDLLYAPELAQITGKAAKCDDVVTGIYVDGYERGKKVKVCPNTSCKVHYKSGKSQGQYGAYARPKLSAAEQLKSAQQTITANMSSEFRKKVYDAAAQRLDLLGADLVKIANKRALLQVLQLVYDRTDSSTRNSLTAEFGFKKGQYGKSAPAPAVVKYAEKFDAGQLMALTIKIALRNLSLGFTSNWNSEGKQADVEIVEIAQAFGVKTDPIKVEIEGLKKEKLAKAKSRIETSAKSAKSKTKASKMKSQTSAKPESETEDDLDDADLDE